MVKAALQGAFSCLPKRHSLNHLLQRHTGSLEKDIGPERSEKKIKMCREHVDAYFEFTRGQGPKLFRVLDLGTGWFPLVPIGLYLCGASHVWTIDVASLLNAETLHQTLQAYRRYAEAGRLLELLPRAEKARILFLIELATRTSSQPVDETLELMNVRRMIGDARRTGLPSHSIDLFVSNATLEHIPKDIIADIFSEFRRLASSEALMSHSIDLQDHYSYFDRSITVFNFLKFSSRSWAFFNNPLNYQNRLRLSDHRRLHESSGWNVRKEERVCGSVEDLRRVYLSREFRSYSEEDLLALECRLVSVCQKPQGDGSP